MKEQDAAHSFDGFEGHTPGPWRIRFFREDDPEQGFFVEANKTNPNAGYDIEILSDDLGNYPIEQKLADCKLVAAAPDLLAELTRLRSELQQERELRKELIQKLTYFKHDTGIIDKSNWRQIEALMKKQS